ncbi:Manganese/iron superoxide dismutase-like protein [Evansella cellulosilytica DSM 2522]|uniref:superoxide dismutase n=2 Tax=Evansella TaxID=2837485 RepID=E6TYM4_EVAC2|nr:Manganese/iron superoxide dismutase-like protein [Evansella cellulosilytica DSM 2522]
MLDVNDYIEKLKEWLNDFEEQLHQSDGLSENFVDEVKGLQNKLSREEDHGKLGKIQYEAEQLYDRYINSRAVESRNENDGESKRVAIGEHTLPRLNYQYHDLEPYIARRIMELHHKKHHQSYVDGLNKAEKELQRQRERNHFELVKHWERELAFHGAGHYLHTLFWKVMTPKGGGQPNGALLKQFVLDFGSFEAFKAHFSEAAKNVEGSGWAILVWSPRPGRLEVLTAEKHQNLTQWDVIPLLPLDVWEHAYYLQYENKREDYISNWWKVINWPYVQQRFNEVRNNVSIV